MKRFTGKVSFVTKGGSVYARATYNESGKRKQVWRRVEGPKADAKLHVINEIERRLNQAPKERTFRDLCDYYRQHHCVPAEFVEDVKVRGKKSWKIMLLDVGELERFFGDKKLNEITRDEIYQYRISALSVPVRRLQQGKPAYRKRSIATIHHHLRTLRSMLGVASDLRWLRQIPSFRGLISAASEPKRELIPSDEEVEKILQACNTRERLHHCKPILMMMADIGARPIELWNLKWDDLNLEEGWVILTSDKGKRRVRTRMFLTPRLKEELEKLERYNEYVFGGIQSIKNAWKSIQKISGVKCQMYSLRHYYGRRLKEKGYDYMDVMLALRHTRLDTNLRYVDLNDERRREMATSLSRPE